MVKVKKYEDEMGAQIILKFPQDLDLQLYYGGNLDLYFLPIAQDNRDHFLFEIKKSEDTDLYQIFNEMFKRVTSYKPNGTRVDENFKWLDQQSDRPLVNKDGMVTWFSDDAPQEIAAFVTIYKQDGKICLFFKKGITKEKTRTSAIRFATEGSRYRGFYVPFLEIYNQINSHDFGDREIKNDELMLNMTPRSTDNK